MSTSTAPRCLRKTFLQITKSDCKSPSRWDAFSELCVSLFVSWTTRMNTYVSLSGLICKNISKK